MYSRDMRVYFVTVQNLIFFSHNLYVKSWQKFVTGKCIPGKHSKIKKEHKMSQKLLQVFCITKQYIFQNKAIC